MTPSRPDRLDGQAPTAIKLELVLRLLAGERLEDLAREAGRPPKQLTAWRRRFLEGGKVYLEGRRNAREPEELLHERAQLAVSVTELEASNRELRLRLAALDAEAEHPYCTKRYAHAFEEGGVRALRVPAWRAHVLVRDTQVGKALATGIRPFAPLDPGADVAAGLASLREAGISSISLVTDPMWCPELSTLETAFDICRPFKQSYYVDREAAEVRFRKRHRNRVNQALRTGEVQEISLIEHLDCWLAFYAENTTRRRVSHVLGAGYFEQLATLDGLRTVGVLVAGELVAMTLWVRHGDILYYNDGASSEHGLSISASYAAFAHVIEQATECRYVFLGGSSDFRDLREDGLAVFKRGFSNASTASYLCSAVLDRL